ncbi:MAG TPA: PEP-CTERM sorting domain-containing protein [Terriglobia bacterium]|nr:PEP-CTERM sorting domain-containing protein [Terriglobia bacterium]
MNRKKSAGRAREAARLSESFNHRLKTYALAAGAAGVGVLALAPAAQAGTTPVPFDINGPNCFGHQCTSVLANLVDPAGFGTEFNFADYYKSVTRTKSQLGSLHIVPLGTGAGFLSSFLAAGAKIGTPQQIFSSSFRTASVTVAALRGIGGVQQASVGGPWNPTIGQIGYLGFEFTNPSTSQTDYGWAQIQLSFNNTQGPGFDELSGVITKFGYDPTGGCVLAGGGSCTPATPTPEPGSASLMLLALGSLGLMAWRKKQASAA